MSMSNTSTEELQERFDKLKAELTKRQKAEAKADEGTKILRLLFIKRLLTRFTEEQALFIYDELNSICFNCLDGPPDCYCERQG